jgi:hypothetical protein
MPAFIQDYTWRELCREWILRASAAGELPVPIEQVGGYWQRAQEIELCGIAMMDRSLVLATVHWNETPAHLDVIADLIGKVTMILPESDDTPWRIYFLGFSAAGWADGVLENSQRLADSKANGKQRWQPMGVKLLSLEEVDQDLQRWSR